MIASVRNTALKYFCIKRYFSDDFLQQVDFYSTEEFEISANIYAAGEFEKPALNKTVKVNANEFIFDTFLSVVSAQHPQSEPIKHLGANYVTDLFEMTVMAYPRPLVIAENCVILDATYVFKGQSDSILSNYGAWSEMKKRDVINRTWKDVAVAHSLASTVMMQLNVTIPHEVSGF